MLWITICTQTFFFFSPSSAVCTTHNIAGYWFLQQKLNPLATVQMKSGSYFITAAWVSLASILYALWCFYLKTLITHTVQFFAHLQTCWSWRVQEINPKWRIWLPEEEQQFGLCAVAVHHSCWITGSSSTSMNLWRIILRQKVSEKILKLWYGFEVSPSSAYRWVEQPKCSKKHDTHSDGYRDKLYDLNTKFASNEDLENTHNSM